MVYLRPEASRTLPLSRSGVLVLFFIKLGAALAYGYIIGNFAPGEGDCWGYFEASRQLAAAIHSTSDFFYWCFPSLTHWTALFHYAFWNDLRGNCFELLLLVMNGVTAHNFYTDTLLLCMLTFGGWLQFLRLMNTLFPGYASWIYALPFLFPSFLFFYSGLHPDSIVFALLGFISFDLYRIMTEDRVRRLVRVRLIGCFCLLAIFKVFLLLLLLPLLAGWWFGRPGYHWLGCRWAIILAGTILIFAATHGEIASRQQSYLSLRSHSGLATLPLEPTFSSFVKHLPDALWRGFWSPAPWGSAPLLYRLAGGEVLILWALFVYGAIKRVRWHWSFYEAGWIYLAAVNWLLIGYTIPILGALIRYRSLFLPFLLPLFLFPVIRAFPKPGKSL
jgi:hypothetical protein